MHNARIIVMQNCDTQRYQAPYRPIERPFNLTLTKKNKTMSLSHLPFEHRKVLWWGRHHKTAQIFQKYSPHSLNCVCPELILLLFPLTIFLHWVLQVEQDKERKITQWRHAQDQPGRNFPPVSHLFHCRQKALPHFCCNFEKHFVHLKISACPNSYFDPWKAWKIQKRPFLHKNWLFSCNFNTLARLSLSLAVGTKF